MPKNFEQINSENKKSNEQAELEESISAAEHICPDIKGGVEQVIRTEKRMKRMNNPNNLNNPSKSNKRSLPKALFPII